MLAIRLGLIMWIAQGGPDRRQRYIVQSMLQSERYKLFPVWNLFFCTPNSQWWHVSYIILFYFNWLMSIRCAEIRRDCTDELTCAKFRLPYLSCNNYSSTSDPNTTGTSKRLSIFLSIQSLILLTRSITFQNDLKIIGCKENTFLESPPTNYHSFHPSVQRHCHVLSIWKQKPGGKQEFISSILLYIVV